MLCNWVIVSPHIARLVLTFVEIDVEYLYDFVYIGQGSQPGNRSSMILALTGELPPLRVVCHNSNNWIQFTSDKIIPARGFALQYAIVEAIGKMNK